MKRSALLFLAFILFSMHSHAQHLDFMGIPMEGNINDFTECMRQRYPLQKKVGGEHYYIYKGTVCGHDSYLKAEYSRKSRTVYKITVTPKNIDQNAYVDSLTVRYGEAVRIEKGYRWNVPGGTVLLYMLEGYDPVLMLFDEQGVAAFRKEQ